MKKTWAHRLLAAHYRQESGEKPFTTEDRKFANDFTTCKVGEWCEKHHFDLHLVLDGNTGSESTVVDNLKCLGHAFYDAVLTQQVDRAQTIACEIDELIAPVPKET